MIRRADTYGIDALFLFQHHAEVIINLCVRKLFNRFACSRAVDIAQRYEGTPGLCNIGDFASAFAPDADTGNIKSLVSTPDAARNIGEGKGRGGGRCHEFTTADSISFHGSPFNFWRNHKWE